MTLQELFANPWIQSASIVLSAFVLASIIHLFLNIFVRRFAAKTKTDLDDQILEIIIKPIYLIMILIGLNIAARTVESQLKEIAWIDKIFFIVYALIAAYVAAKILSLLIVKWLHVSKKFEKTPKLIGKVVGVIVFLIAGIIILDKLEIQITPFIATLGIGGLAIGLALQNTLSNLFAGLHILSDEPVKVGDFIELEGAQNVAGRVEDIGWRSTRIKTLTNNIVVVPNAKLSDSIIINDTMNNAEFAFAVHCGVSYDSDLDKVESVAVDVAKNIQKKVPGAVKSHEPALRFNKFADSNIEFTIGLRAQTYEDKFLMTHELIKALKRAFDKSHIEISHPVRRIYTQKRR